jgi:FHS family L-fucose permease-like MFS transporter
VNYLSHGDIGNLPLVEAGKWVSFYWGGAMIGRFIGAYLQRMIQPARILRTYALCALFLVLFSMYTNGLLAAGTILSVGFFNSIMFPTIFTLALSDLGSRASQGSGWLCTAIVGGAVVPLLQGMLADRIGLQSAFFVPVLCYSYIAYYGFKRSTR